MGFFKTDLEMRTVSNVEIDHEHYDEIRIVVIDERYLCDIIIPHLHIIEFANFYLPTFYVTLSHNNIYESIHPCFSDRSQWIA